MGSVSSMRHHQLPVVLLLLSVVWFRVRAGKVATELITPDFSASYYLFIDTVGVFLKSRNGAFQAVVYNPSGQQEQARYYLAVVHAPSKTCVWVANRAAPIVDPAAPLQLTKQGISIEDPNGTVVWSTPPFGVSVAALRLHDTGNLELLDARNATLWQSFDIPTDSIVSSQRLPVGGFLASAASESDLSEGRYRLSVTAADAVLTWMGSLYWRLSSDGKSIKDRDGVVQRLLVNGTGLYLLAEDGGVVIQVTLPAAELRIVKLSFDGKLHITSFASANTSSTPIDGGFEAPGNGCELPLSCGALGLCTPRGCTCPPLFAASQDGGCTPSDGSTALSDGSCNSSSATEGSRLPASYASLGNGVTYYANKFVQPDLAGQNISSCRALCTSNCSCIAYFYVDASSSCYLVQHQLGSVTSANSTGGSDRLGYIKVQSSQSQGSSKSSASNSTLVAILLPTVIAFVLIVIVSGVVINSWRKEKRRASRSRVLQLRRKRSPSDSTHLVREIDDDGGDDIVIPGLPTRFTHEEIEDMTNSYRIKIGAGGFGAVYKGQLPDGSLVAVKKIEGVGMQGKREFCTEIAVIGNIHHVNLVRLRGFCTEGQRRLLVYEYMNRGSLDRSLFRPAGPLLEWKERMDVAVGAARGLAYLHFGCHQRIIHCDVKPENILLADGGLVKIADFGLAKFLTPEQSGLFTTMRGTRGYLAPEWLSNAPITNRTDVYSFGMVLLELVRGRKNRSERVSGGGGNEASGSSSGTTGSSASRSDYFPLAALEAYEAGQYKELADPRLEGRVVVEEVERVVKVALCCLHEDPPQRPSMAVVVGMLEGTMELWEPRVQSLGFLRLYGRGCAGSAAGGGSDDINLNQMRSGGDRSGTTTLTTMSGWPSYMSSSQLSGPSGLSGLRAKELRDGVGGAPERAGAGDVAGRAATGVRAAGAGAAGRDHVPRGRRAGGAGDRHVGARCRRAHRGGGAGVGPVPGGQPRRARGGGGGAAARRAGLLRAAAGGEAAVRVGPGVREDRGLRHQAAAGPRGQEDVERLLLPRPGAAGDGEPRHLAPEPRRVQGGQRGVLPPHAAADGAAVRAPLPGARPGEGRHGGSVRRRPARVPAEDQLLPAVSAAGAHARPGAAHRHVHAHHPRAQRGAGPPDLQGRPLVRRQVRAGRAHHPHRRPDRDFQQRGVQGGAAPFDGEQGEDADVVACFRGAAAGARRGAAPAARHRREPGQVQGQEVQGLPALQDQQAADVTDQCRYRHRWSCHPCALRPVCSVWASHISLVCRHVRSTTFASTVNLRVREYESK